MTLPMPPLARDLTILHARVGLGIVFLAHGWQMLTTNGLDATAADFAKLGIPLPSLAAWFAAWAELLGGAALLLGAAVPIAGVLLALTMAGAYVFVHAGQGVFVQQGGFELVAALNVGALLLAMVGAGRFSIDHLASSRRSRRAENAAA